MQQLEWSDCGAACLAMVLRYHGREMRLEDVRELVGAGRDGTDAAQILDAAERCGMRGRGLKLEVADLREGMMLEGTVSNVAQFGAFVDLGVHQDGLVHVSQLSNKFVTDAREVVKTGDIVKVKVVEVDLARQRISLTMKLDAATGPKGAGASRDNSFRPAARNERSSGGAGRGAAPQAQGQGQSAMAAAFAKLQTKR